LEFNVPFQHKYGYIRDEGKLVKDLYSASVLKRTRIWANAQRDGRPAKHRWRRLFNAAKFS